MVQCAVCGQDISCLLWALIMWQLVMWDTGSGNWREQTRHHREQDMEICDGDVECQSWENISLHCKIGILNFELNFEPIFILASFKRVVRVTCNSANRSSSWISLSVRILQLLEVGALCQQSHPHILNPNINSELEMHRAQAVESKSANNRLSLVARGMSLWWQ